MSSAFSFFVFTLEGMGLGVDVDGCGTSHSIHTLTHPRPDVIDRSLTIVVMSSSFIKDQNDKKQVKTISVIVSSTSRASAVALDVIRTSDLFFPLCNNHPIHCLSKSYDH